MAYKLLDSNGKYMNINGMHKGTIVSPYKYQGMSAWNDSSYYTSYRPFYGTYRRIYIDGTYYQVSSTSSSSPTYIDDAYEATSVAIAGRYNSSSYKAYEVYVDGTLVASGNYTSQVATIYTLTKAANTCITIEGTYVNSVMTYNITTNATINRQNSYNWNNGIVTTSTLTKNGTVSRYGTSNTVGITTPTQEEILAMLPSDCVIMSATYSTKFMATSSHSGSTKFTYYFRTDYDNSTTIITTLPGSSLGTISNLGYNQSGNFTRTGTSYLGKTYYIYYHASNWSSGQYRSLTSLTYDSISSTTTATVKYRYFDEVHTVIVNVTRTNVGTLPSYTLTQVQALLPQFGTSTVSSFRYHYTVKNNASSGSYTYFRIMEGTTVKYGPVYLGLGSTITNYATYTSNMPSTLVLQMSSASDGTYISASDSYISFPNEDGAHYLEIFYTWSPE